MLKTFYFFFIFWVVLMMSLLLLVIFYILILSGQRKTAKRGIFLITSRWARFTLFTAGIKLSVTGQENIPPSHTGFVVASNHQGNFDIPVFVACLPFSPGFVAKKELLKLPFISNWMKILECVSIDRDNPRESREVISKRINDREKNPIFLFPEGTRSKGPQMGAFKKGTLKLLFQDRSDVLPVTLDGSYKLFEKQGNIRGGKVNIYFHPVMKTSNYKPEDFELFNSDLQKIISQPLQNTEQG